MVQAPRFCTGCGHALSPTVAFCTRCGKPVRRPAAPPGPAYGAHTGPGAYVPPAPAGPIQPGVTVRGKYVIEKRLGAGGMGRVYLARHRDMRIKTFAVKEMNFENLSGTTLAEATERFFAEAETLAELNHPLIPHVFERFEEGGRYLMVMEFVEGTDLEKLLEVHQQAKGAPLPEAAVARVALQVCEALEYLHRREPPVIHRDIKPANALVTPSGRVKLVDFGIARTTDRRHTQAGTVGYASKEQYEGATEPRSDLFSLGATLHHLLTGRLPVPFNFPPVRQYNPAVSQAFEALVAHMLELEKENRPDSARTVWKRLQALHPDQALVAPGDPDALTAVIESLRPSGLLPQAPSGGPQSPSLAPPSPGLSPQSPGLAPQARGHTSPAPAPSAPLRCSKCGQSNRPTSRFCTECGGQLTT